MSAFMCTDYHISYLVGCLKRAGYVHALDAESTATSLHAANLFSVNVRYPHRADDDDERPEFKFSNEGYRDGAMGTFPLVQVIKSAQCFDYQACEPEGYFNSETARLMRSLISWAIGELPGYSDAQWGPPAVRYDYQIRTLEDGKVRIVSTHSSEIEAHAFLEWLGSDIGSRCFVGSVKVYK